MFIILVLCHPGRDENRKLFLPNSVLQAEWCSLGRVLNCPIGQPEGGVVTQITSLKKCFVFLPTWGQGADTMLFSETRSDITNMHLTLWIFPL